MTPNNNDNNNNIIIIMIFILRLLRLLGAHDVTPFLDGPTGLEGQLTFTHLNNNIGRGGGGQNRYMECTNSVQTMYQAATLRRMRAQTIGIGKHPWVITVKD